MYSKRTLLLVLDKDFKLFQSGVRLENRKVLRKPGL